MNPETSLTADTRIDEYVLIGKLSSYSHVWHAYDQGAQREVVLKFVEDRESADRESAILADIDHPNILKLFRRFEYKQMTVLVFEYVPGIRLDKAIQDGLSLEQSYIVCLNICSALEAIHKYGLFHGDLSPFNVIWSEEKHKAYLIDFGAMGGCTVLSAAPEHDPNSDQRIGPKTDIVGLGRIMMMLLPKLKSTYDRCLYDRAELRPSAMQVHKELTKHRDRRKMFLRTLAAILVLHVVGIATAIYVKTSQPLTRETILNRYATATPEKAIPELRRLLKDPEFASYRGQVIKLIADHTKTQQRNNLVLDDLSDYVAIFAFEEDPLIILKNTSLTLGDWITIENSSGYVQEINKGNIILKTKAGSLEIRYPKPTIFNRQDIQYQRVNILPGKTNFLKILRTIADHANYELVENEAIDGRIAGSVNVTNYLEFLQVLVQDVEISRYTVSVIESEPPRSIILGRSFWVINGNLSDLLDKHQLYTGYQIELDASDIDGFIYPITNFKDLTAALGLEYKVDGNQILVIEGETKDEKR